MPVIVSGGGSGGGSGIPQGGPLTQDLDFGGFNLLDCNSIFPESGPVWANPNTRIIYDQYGEQAISTVSDSYTSDFITPLISDPDYGYVVVNGSLLTRSGGTTVAYIGADGSASFAADNLTISSGGYLSASGGITTGTTGLSYDGSAYFGGDNVTIDTSGNLSTSGSLATNTFLLSSTVLNGVNGSSGTVLTDNGAGDILTVNGSYLGLILEGVTSLPQTTNGVPIFQDFDFGNGMGPNPSLFIPAGGSFLADYGYFDQAMNWGASAGGGGSYGILDNYNACIIDPVNRILYASGGYTPVLNWSSQAAAIADPTGGTVVDVQARAQLATLLATLRTYGLIAT